MSDFFAGSKIYGLVDFLKGLEKIKSARLALAEQEKQKEEAEQAQTDSQPQQLQKLQQKKLFLQRFADPRRSAQHCGNQIVSLSCADKPLECLDFLLSKDCLFSINDRQFYKICSFSATFTLTGPVAVTIVPTTTWTFSTVDNFEIAEIAAYILLSGIEYSAILACQQCSQCLVNAVDNKILITLNDAQPGICPGSTGTGTLVGAPVTGTDYFLVFLVSLFLGELLQSVLCILDTVAIGLLEALLADLTALVNTIVALVLLLADILLVDVTITSELSFGVCATNRCIKVGECEPPAPPCKDECRDECKSKTQDCETSCISKEKRELKQDSESEKSYEKQEYRKKSVSHKKSNFGEWLKDNSKCRKHRK